MHYHSTTTPQNGVHSPTGGVMSSGQKRQVSTNSGSTVAPYTLNPFHDVCRPVKMVIDPPGVAGSLSFVDDDAADGPLGSDEVKIRGLSFALNPAILGSNNDSAGLVDCAGVVTSLGSDMKDAFRIGDRVCCWNASAAVASQTRAKGCFVQRLPPSWSFKTGAALPRILSLAYYGLQDCAQVESGQTVLVKGASELLGQAVTLVATLLGLKVVAIVGTDTEKQALLSNSGAQPAHIFYSNDIALPDALLRLTRGAGLDAVLNASSTALPEDLIKSVAPFGTVVDMNGRSLFSPASDRSVKRVSFDATQLFRYRPFLASAAFKSILSLLPDEDIGSVFPLATVSIADALSALQIVESQTQAAKIVLLADDDAIVKIKASTAPKKVFTEFERLARAIANLSVPQEQKRRLLALITISQPSATEPEVADRSTPDHDGASAERHLAAVSSMSEARRVVLDEQLRKLVSLVAISADQVNLHEPLVDLGLDSLIVTDFKDWLGSKLGAEVAMHEVTNAPGLVALAELVAQRSKFVPDGLPEETTLTQASEVETVSRLPKSPTLLTNGAVNGVGSGTVHQDAGMNGNPPFVPNPLPKFPLPEINALCNAFLTGVKAFATPAEFNNTIAACEDFKRAGGPGRLIYDRAAARAADPAIENWEWELQLQRGFLDRRVSLTPFTSFWMGHPFSHQPHSQAERAALLACTVNNFKLKLEAGHVGPVVLNQQELTTAFYPWIFNAVRVPGIPSDAMQRHPNNNYCIVFWRGHAFKLSLSVGSRPATYPELHAAFELLLSQSVARSFVSILTSDNRPSWAKARQQLQRLDHQNAVSIAAIEAAAFTVSLDEAAPENVAERSRQFHLGGESDAANRWHDKSLQFVVCRNGISATLGEHSMLDALTLRPLSDAIGAAITNDAEAGVRAPAAATRAAVMPELLPLKTDATLEALISKVRAQYADTTKDADHAVFLFEGFGSTVLRAQKLSPKSVFQMVIQLAGYSIFGELTPCFESVNQAHYHLGRVDIIQVVNTQVAAFVKAARDPAVDMAERRSLLINATRAHVASVAKAGRNAGWERNLTALRALLNKGEPVPALFEDPIYKRVRPRLMMSNCFETGMLDKGCMWKDPNAIWMHYEVYEECVHFTVVTSAARRATQFCQHLKEATELVKQMIFLE
ncbi:uncharacterized protein E0L32_009993 [Thyridium curvatum]|uniref:Carrier domain-containing protein n=1 Tax=Thyridium curvatum TaxID=1093900 RepID=A0A507AP78_9PEZI|nr:uncharacterized protein E0L32_009993 [Thyridium curvatum]TPX08506.1 hypothetical protein E0L32_009993 [Thyridium curvatum]